MASATDNFFYTPDETLLLTAAQELVSEVDTEDISNMVFIPDNPIEVPNKISFILEVTKKDLEKT